MICFKNLLFAHSPSGGREGEKNAFRVEHGSRRFPAGLSVFLLPAHRAMAGQKHRLGGNRSPGVAPVFARQGKAASVTASGQPHRPVLARLLLPLPCSTPLTRRQRRGVTGQIASTTRVRWCCASKQSAQRRRREGGRDTQWQSPRSG